MDPQCCDPGLSTGSGRRCKEYKEGVQGEGREAGAVLRVLQALARREMDKKQELVHLRARRRRREDGEGDRRPRDWSTS
jgi:hypothetical protein